MTKEDLNIFEQNASNSGFNIIRYSPTLGYKTLSSPGYTCKAYMWDYMQNIIVDEVEDINNIFILFDISTKDTYSTENQFSGYIDWQTRVSNIEGILGFEPTQSWITSKSLVFKPDLRFFSCVELFALYLSAIRHWNYSDTKGVELFTQNPTLLLEYINTLNADYKKNWARKPGTYSKMPLSIHGEGINQFYSVGKGYYKDEGCDTRGAKIRKAA